MTFASNVRDFVFMNHTEARTEHAGTPDVLAAV